MEYTCSAKVDSLSSRSIWKLIKKMKQIELLVKSVGKLFSYLDYQL